MKLSEFLQYNMFITDLVLEVRADGNRLVDACMIGPVVGIEPPFPLMIQKPGMSLGQKEKALYSAKSINAADDDGKDYFQVFPNRIPKKFRDLEVFSFKRHYSTGFGHRGYGRGSNEAYTVILLPESSTLSMKEEKPAKTAKKELTGWDHIDGQISLFDLEGDVCANVDMLGQRLLFQPDMESE